MKITDIEAIYLHLPEIDALRCDGTQDTLLVRIHTDEGLTGIGEVDSSPQVAKAIIEASASHLISNGLKDIIIGEDPFDREKLWNNMFHGSSYYGRQGAAIHAISGIDMALWDIVGKGAERSTAQMLGGVYRNRVKAYASLVMPETIKEACLLAEKYMGMGYKAIKFGWGPFGEDEYFDVEAVKAIRSVIGERTELMIDIGQRWDAKHAIKMARRFEEYGVHWIEEPLAPDDLEGYAMLSAATDIHIAAGENESGRKAFERLMKEGRVDIIQPDLGRCGGLTEGKKIADLAYAEHKKIVPHAFKTGILVAASTHFAASIPNGFLMEYTVSDSPLARTLVQNPVLFKDGYVHLPDRPGLGIEIDPDAEKRFRV
ncbi:mandelate racemase/muconate lactonizing enzyme family protein [Bacillus sp. FSL H8-0547]